MGEYNVPEHTMGALRRYVDNGLHPGGFLKAVLENNLFQAFSSADYANRIHMFDIVRHIYNEEPNSCWGHKGIVENWCKEKRKEK